MDERKIHLIYKFDATKTCCGRKVANVRTLPAGATFRGDVWALCGSCLHGDSSYFGTLCEKPLTKLVRVIGHAIGFAAAALESL
jgi:hypothetical protein